MHLSKHHGLGNDFLVALVDNVPADAPELALLLCHRTRGVGADGLIFGTPTADADLKMTLLNADGSLAEISGNGIRCLAQAFATDQGAASTDLVIVTDAGSRTLRLVPGCTPDEVQVSVDMGRVTPGPEVADHAVPLRDGFEVRRVGTGEVGNPHLILEVDHLGGVDPGVDGPPIEAAWMPGGINVHFLEQSGPNEISLVHWERGAGATQACGSGAVVSASVANRWGIVGQEVSVRMPGGSVRIELGETAVLIGPAVHIADIEVAYG